MSRSFTAASSQSLSNTSPPNPGYPFTVAGWFYPSVNDASARTIFMLEENAGVPNRYGIFLISLGVRIAIGDAGNAQATDSTTTCTINTWNHYAAVFTSATSRTVYLNAGGSATGTTSITPTGITKLEMGAWAGGNKYTGLLSDVAVWSSALTSGNITSLSGKANPQAISAGTLLAYWAIPGTTSPEPSTVGSYPLTLNNAPPQGGSDPGVNAYGSLPRGSGWISPLSQAVNRSGTY